MIDASLLCSSHGALSFRAGFPGGWRYEAQMGLIEELENRVAYGRQSRPQASGTGQDAGQQVY